MGIGLINLLFLLTITRILNKKLILKLKSGVFKLLTIFTVVLEPFYIIYVKMAQGETISLNKKFLII
jgi:hypothetical protein